KRAKPGELRDERTVEALIHALNDAHWKVRRNAAVALEKLGRGEG
ncbi:MAG: HEAT repeat domain-containing protein, partial [Methanophagales archaeon ANME-1-THS]